MKPGFLLHCYSQPYPAEEAATVAVGALRSARTDVEVVTLVAFDDRTLTLYRRLLEDAG